MKPFNKHKSRMKEIRALQKERNKLYEAMYNLGYIKLDKPIHDGWFKHLKLRDDISRRKDAHVFEEILKVTLHKVWGRDHKHADKIWNEVNKKNTEIQFPGIRKIYDDDIHKITPKAQRWFEGIDWKLHPWKGQLKRYHCRVPRYYFKIAYTKAYITKRKIIDPEIERRLQEIEQIFLNNKYYSYYYKGNSYKDWYYDFRHKGQRNKVKSAILSYDEDNFDFRIYQDF